MSHGNDTDVILFSVSYTLSSVVLLLYSTCIGPTRPFPRNFTVRNEVAKVMFLQVSICPRGGMLPAPRGERLVGGCLLPGGLIQGVVWSGRCLLPGGCACSRGCLVGGVPARGDVVENTPPSRRLLWQTVRILLECILVKWNVEQCHNPRL